MSHTNKPLEGAELARWNADWWDRCLDRICAAKSITVLFGEDCDEDEFTFAENSSVWCAVHRFVADRADSAARKATKAEGTA
jgi:hypothetical protein